MTGVSHLFPLHHSENLRPFDARRDMQPVADLIETCFANTLDADGRGFIHRMRTMAQSPGVLTWAAERVGMPLRGFVWEEDGEVVGNLSMIPVTAPQGRTYLIANVAVHPDYRRHGIARTLTEMALDRMRARGMHTAWLQARADNPPAIALYTGLGFSEIARRTTWHNTAQHTNQALSKIPTGYKVTLRRDRDWSKQRQWLKRAYPPEVIWYMPLRFELLKAGFLGMFVRMLSDRRVRQFSLRKDGRLLGVICWQSSFSQANRLWLAASPEYEEETAAVLLSYVQMTVTNHKIMALDYPAGHATAALEAAGFHKHQTLIWMRKEL
ncbi:MAG: GNAT family N-acetyltransferase [Anaerolineales bacterium]|nr:GNAT family N-acetyltransferase [Anaerolineales bacterium]